MIDFDGALSLMASDKTVSQKLDRSSGVIKYKKHHSISHKLTAYIAKPCRKKRLGEVCDVAPSAGKSSGLRLEHDHS